MQSQSSSGSSGSGGPASPRELNDNVDAGQHQYHYHHHINDSASAVASAHRSPSAVRSNPHEQEQKLSKLFASAMRTSEEDAGLVGGSGELITLKSVFSNAVRLSGNTGSSSNNNHHLHSGSGAPAPENRRSFAGAGPPPPDTDGGDFEEFSDDSLEEGDGITEHSSRTPSLASSMTSLPPPPPMQQPHQHQPVAHKHQMRQVADVHAVQNGLDDGDNETGFGLMGNATRTDADDVCTEVAASAAAVAADNGPWVLREDIVLSQSAVFGRKSNLVSVRH